MTLFFALILGIIEGITEFLPVSSTGHLILASTLFGIPDTPFRSSFEIAIQLGAISAVIALFFIKVCEKPRALIPVMYAFVPTAVVGFVLYKIIKHVLLGNPFIVVAALVIGGVVMLLLERRFATQQARAAKFDVDGGVESTEITDWITPKKAVLIGLCQSLAVIPGVSRSAATIYGGMALGGIPRKTIVEFSFLLAVPTMLAAAGYDLLKTGATFTEPEWKILALGAIMAFATALLVVTELLDYASRHSFAVFAWYRIIAGIVLAFVLLR